MQYGVGLRPSFYIGSLGGASPTLQIHFELSTHDMYSSGEKPTAHSVKAEGRPPNGAQGARLDFGMHEHRLEFGIAERTTSTSAQHKFELESVGLVLGGPAGAAPSDVLTRQPAVAARLCCSWSYRAPGLTTS